MHATPTSKYQVATFSHLQSRESPPEPKLTQISFAVREHELESVSTMPESCILGYRLMKAFCSIWGTVETCQCCHSLLRTPSCKACGECKHPVAAWLFQSLMKAECWLPTSGFVETFCRLQGWRTRKVYSIIVPWPYLDCIARHFDLLGDTSFVLDLSYNSYLARHCNHSEYTFRLWCPPRSRIGRMGRHGSAWPTAG